MTKALLKQLAIMTLFIFLGDCLGALIVALLVPEDYSVLVGFLFGFSWSYYVIIRAVNSGALDGQ